MDKLNNTAEFFVTDIIEAENLIINLSKKYPLRIWQKFKIKYKCEKCNTLVIKQLRVFIKNKNLVCNKKHNPKKITYVCDKCGKTVTINYKKYKNKENKLCKRCEIIKTYGGIENYKNFRLKIAQKSCSTQLKKYGGIGNQNKVANEKRLKTIRNKYGKNFYSEIFKNYYKNKTQEETNKSNLKRITTNLLKYNKSSTGFRHAYYKIDNIYFDSKYEVYFYLYCKDNNIPIKHEPYSLTYFDKNGDIHKYFPDFLLVKSNILVEIKSNYWLSFVSQEKLNIMYKNNVIIITEDTGILIFKDYIDKKYGKSYINQYKIL